MLVVFFRFSTISKVSHQSPPKVDLLSFIQSTFVELEGPYHCWLNESEGNINSSKRDGIFLVLAGQFLDNSSKTSSDIGNMFEKVKSIQKRFPQVNVMGLQSGCSVISADDYTNLVQLIMKEYITFPILLSNKNFSEIEDGACYVLFKDFGGPTFYHEKDLDLGTLKKAVEELSLEHDEKSSLLNNDRSTWWKQPEVIKEPNYCSYMQKLLLYFPGCISADESGNRLFISDSNHHRVIIVDGEGKILDCIGSSPGFEDGEFENAKLFRPAASFYHAADDCLYFVDSENHAIRRADMERRILETLYPTPNANKKNNHMWTWIKDKLGLRRDVGAKSEEFDSRLMMFPWHLIKSEDNSFIVISRSFETVWIMDSASGEIKEVFKGFEKILEICGQLIMDKISLLNQMPCDWLKQQVGSNFSVEGFRFAGLMSSLTAYQDHIIICDTVGQRVLKFGKESGAFSNLQLSNFGVLGLPYWMSFPLERVPVANGFWATQIDHLQHFSFLPGRTKIQLNINIPLDTELAEPLQEGCIWRQARGAAIVVSGAEDIMGSSEKVGVAQKWYDELDNIAYSEPELELPDEDSDTSVINSQGEGIHLDCAINTSPGTSEVSIYVALYLKLKRNPDLAEDNQEKYAARIADILSPQSSGRMGRDSRFKFLLKSNQDMRDLVFIKPLHVKINFDCPNHPKADSSKDVILTDSSVQVNVSLD